MEGLLSGDQDVPDRARLTRIMVSQLEYRVGSIKLPMAHIHNLEKETLSKLKRVHCPGNAGIKATLEGQGQPNLRVFVAHMEQKELSKKVNDQSKIR